MNMQALFDGMAAQWARERSATQMTLGKMIDALETMDPAAMVDGIAEPHSYRGYYTDLAFEPASDKITAADALALCRSAMGEVFTGYKGGDYPMSRLTPLWLAYYGDCGRKIMGIGADGSLETAEDD